MYTKATLYLDYVKRSNCMEVTFDGDMVQITPLNGNPFSINRKKFIFSSVNSQGVRYVIYINTVKKLLRDEFTVAENGLLHGETTIINSSHVSISEKPKTSAEAQQVLAEKEKEAVASTPLKATGTVASRTSAKNSAKATAHTVKITGKPKAVTPKVPPKAKVLPKSKPKAAAKKKDSTSKDALSALLKPKGSKKIPSSKVGL